MALAERSIPRYVTGSKGQKTPKDARQKVISQMQALPEMLKFRGNRYLKFWIPLKIDLFLIKNITIKHISLFGELKLP